MHSHRTGIFSALAAVTLLAAVPHPAVADQHEKTTLEQVRDYGIEKKDDFVAWHKRQMRALETKYEKAEMKMKQTGDKAGKEWEEAKKDLAKARDAASRKLDAASKATKESWAKAKKEAAESYADAKKAYNRALEKAKADK
ncbi:MAG: hypothetical protein GEU76_05620 [Alphaproteobacteria bacterium]|nr:hypothetical protein [Alphaproteobacteria bacterium]